MKTLITSTGQYGPFNSIVQSSDRWLCDGVEYQFSVIGDATIGDYVEPAPLPPSKEVQSALRREAYVAEADPIFFMSQREEATQADWLAKIDEIKQRYPYPV